MKSSAWPFHQNEIVLGEWTLTESPGNQGLDTDQGFLGKGQLLARDRHRMPGLLCAVGLGPVGIGSLNRRTETSPRNRQKLFEQAERRSVHKRSLAL